MTRSVILVDNLDSFSLNLAEAFERLGVEVRIVRNTANAAHLAFDAASTNALVVLSPGPGRPEDAGCCMELIRLAKGRIALLGVCLGHQAIVAEAGGTVTRAPDIVHGKASLIAHDKAGMFRGLPSPFKAARYHSLCTPEPPARFHAHARLDGMAMAIADTHALQWGVQFHPESILTPLGDRILANILTEALP